MVALALHIYLFILSQISAITNDVIFGNWFTQRLKMHSIYHQTIKRRNYITIFTAKESNQTSEVVAFRSEMQKLGENVFFSLCLTVYQIRDFSTHNIFLLGLACSVNLSNQWMC